ncbi:hypothetical protein WA577_003778, partial [Blastocystis sp. JDR]
MNLVQSDAEIIIDNWNSTVLLQVTMDLTTGVNRHTFYIVMNRHGYLPFIFFSPSFASIDLGSLLKSGIEFRCGDVTILWDRPIGVLYDVYAEVGKPLSVSVCSYSKKHSLPYHHLGECEERFVHCLKEAVLVEYGSLQLWDEMPVESQSKLFKSVQTDNYRLYDECVACFKEEEMKEVLVKIVSTEGCETKRIGVEEAKKLTILDLTKKENTRVRALSLNGRSVWYCWSLFRSPD